MAPPKHALLFLGALLTVLSFAAGQPPPPPPPAVAPTPPPPAAAGNGSACDPVTLAVCSNVLNGLLGTVLGSDGIIPGIGADDGQCCPVIQGILGVNVGVCLCTAIRANVLGLVNLNLAPLAVRLLLVHCGQAVPANITCPAA